MLATPFLAALALPPQAGCPAEPILERIGEGTPGTLGIPLHTHEGLPGLGHLFGLRVEQGLPGAPGLWALGSTEDPVLLDVFGAVLYPGQPLRRIPFQLDSDGARTLTDLAPVPSALCGRFVVSQAAIFDPAAEGGLAFTSTYRVRFGQPLGTSFPVPMFEAGPGPRDLEHADLDSDGHLDLVVAHSEGASALLGDGQGLFSESIPLGTGDLARAVAVGDLDADGSPDVLLAHENDDRVSIHLGVGDGTFTAAGDLATGDRPYALALGDFDLDGALDLVVVNRADDSISVFLGQGDGSFGLPAERSLGVQLSAIVAVDLDVDGVLDLALTDEVSNGVVWLLPGLGDGSFGTALSASVNRNPTSLTVGDINGDGKPDIAVANHGDPPLFVGSVSRLLSNAAPFSYSIGPLAFGFGTFPWDVVLADLDLDGITDLIAGSRGNTQNGDDGGLLAGLGSPFGGYFAAQQTAEAVLAQKLTAADFNGDGLVDIAAIAHQENEVVLALGRGEGLLDEAPNYELPEDPEAMAHGDFDLDGAQDLAVVHGSPAVVSVHLGRPGAGFEPAVVYPAGGQSPTDVELSDMDGDGAADIVFVCGGDGRVVVLLGSGDGTFGPPIVSQAGSTSLRRLAVADVDSDGSPDVLTTSSFNSTVRVLLGQGDGSLLETGFLLVTPSPTAIAVSDFDGDGLADFAVAGATGQAVEIFRGLGDGLFFPFALYPTNGPAQSLAVVDVAGDPLADLVVGVSTFAGGHVEVLPALGGGAFGPAEVHAEGSTPFSLLVADASVDGILDLVIGNRFNDSVWVVPGAGQGAFGTPLRFAGGLGTLDVALFDEDGDTLPEVLYLDNFVGSLSVLGNLLLD